MSAFKFIFVFYFCANCVFGFYVPSNSADGESNVTKLINDLTIIKNKLQPNDKGVSGLDEFDTLNNANLLTNGSSTSFNGRSARFINFKKVIKFDYDKRNVYEHGRHFINDHKYCDHRSSEESVEDNTSAFNEWVRNYKQFMTQSSTGTTTKPRADETSITTFIEPTTTETLPSSMAHDDDNGDGIDVRLGEDFNEIELIRLIPSVIENLKANRLTQNDRHILSQVYGDLWLVMEEESKRDRENEKINPILKLILQFKQFHKREIDRRTYTDDYYRNTVDQVENNDRDIIDQPLRIKLGLTENLAQLSPAQRILRTIAMLINNTRYSAVNHKVHDRKNIKVRKPLQKQHRVHPNVIRIRRSSLHHNRNNNNNNIGNDIDLYDSDEQFYRRRVSSFDDNPSITELIKLAEIHRLRRQQKFNKNSINLIEKLYSSSMSNNNDEYYYDDEPESEDNTNDDDTFDDDDEYEEDDNEFDY